MVKDVVKLSMAYALAAITTIVCIVLIVAVPTVVSRLTRPKIHEVTSPLDASVVGDLCQKLDLATDNPSCQFGAIVYAPDFFPAVRAQFTDGETTYDDVQSKLAAYQYEKEPIVTMADGTSYFRCWYDFRGDHVFPVVFSFTADGLLERFSATTGDDWP